MTDFIQYLHVHRPALFCSSWLDDSAYIHPQYRRYCCDVDLDARQLPTSRW